MKKRIDTLEKHIEKYVKEEGEELPPDQTNAFQSIMLTRWKQGKNKRAKSVSLNIQLHSFVPHEEDCSLCSKFQPDAPEVLSLLQDVAWQYTEISVASRRNRSHVLSLNKDGNSVKVFTVHKDGTWSVRVYGRLVSSNHSALVGISSQLCSRTDIEFGIQAIHFTECLPRKHGAQHTFRRAPTEQPVYRHMYPDNSTIRHNSCPLLTPDNRCGPCSIYRSTLATISKAEQTKAQNTSTCLSQYVPFRHLPLEEIGDTLRTSKQSAKTMKKGSTLEKRIEKYVKEEGEELPPDQTNIVSLMMMNLLNSSIYHLIRSPQKNTMGTASEVLEISTKTNAVAPCPSAGVLNGQIKSFVTGQTRMWKSLFWVDKR